MDLLNVYCMSWLKYFILNSLGFPSDEACVWYFLLRTILYNIPNFDTLLWHWRGLHFSTFCSLHCELLCFIRTSYLGRHWQGLAQCSESRCSCGLVPSKITVFFPAWRQSHSSQFKYCAVCNIAPTLLAKTFLSCVRTLLMSVYIMDSSTRKRSPIVLGPIQTFPVLDRFSSEWMQARTGVWGGGRMWHTSRIVVCKSWCCDLSKKTFVCVWCLLGLF